MRAKHGGSAPDFGDPAEALADMDAKATRLFAVLGDFEEARLAVTVNPSEPDAAERYRASRLTEAAFRGPFGRGDGDHDGGRSRAHSWRFRRRWASHFLTRDRREVRERSAAQQVDAMAKVFGGRLAANDRAKIEAAFLSVREGARRLAHGRHRGRALARRGGAWSGDRRRRDRSKRIRHARSSQRSRHRRTDRQLDRRSQALRRRCRARRGTKTSCARCTSSAARPRSSCPRTRPKRPKRLMESDAFDIVWAIGKERFFAAAGRDAKQALASLQKSRRQRDARAQRRTAGRGLAARADGRVRSDGRRGSPRRGDCRYRAKTQRSS